MHHPERRFVYYRFSQVQPTKVFVEGTFILYLTCFRCASCYLLWRHELKYPLIQPFFWNIWKGYCATQRATTTLTGTSGPEDRPVACATVPEVVEREGLCSPVRRSLSTDDLTVAEVSELPELPFTSSVSPMQGQHSSRSTLSLTSETNSSHSTIFNSTTKPTPQVCKNTLRHTCFERNHAKVLLSSREQRKLATWYKRFQGCIVKGLLTLKTSLPRKRHRSKITNGHPCG